MSDAALALASAKTARTLVTPEGVALNLQLALAGQRISAFLLDLMFMLGALILLTIALVLGAFAVGQQSKAGAAAFNIAAALWLLGFFFIRNGYFILAEMSPRAATFGKRIVGLRVVARNGGQLTADAVIARNLVRELEFFLPLSFLVQEAGESGVESAAWLLGLVWTGIFLFFPLFNRDRLRIGDLLAGTWVIHAPKRKLGLDLLDKPAEAPARFTDAQLAAYGVYELQTLEGVLRNRNPEGMATVAAAIRAKTGIAADQDDEAFLRDYYAALRVRLERGLLLGRRKANKHER
jgi:uncharacterized RDD family membrane protein YckC